MSQINLFDEKDDPSRSLLDELLQKSKLYHYSSGYKALLDFVVRLRNFAPFNAMLLQLQKPGLRFAASEYDWKQRFNRTIKEGARPLIILWPFGPIALVYDVDDTEGADLPDDVAQAFRATGAMTVDQFAVFAHRLSKLGIDLKSIAYGSGKAGHIEIGRRSKDAKERPVYRIRVNEKHDANVKFATLAHELAHLYLGHLGPDKFLGIAKRPPLPDSQKELEAESVSYLVCTRNAVVSESEKYLANYVKTNATIENLDLHVMLKAAGQIEAALDLSEHTHFGPVPKKKTNRLLLS